MDEVLQALIDLLAHHDAHCRLKTDNKPCGHPGTSDSRALAVLRARVIVAAAKR